MSMALQKLSPNFHILENGIDKICHILSNDRYCVDISKKKDER